MTQAESRRNQLNQGQLRSRPVEPALALGIGIPLNDDRRSHRTGQRDDTQAGAHKESRNNSSWADRLLGCFYNRKIWPIEVADDHVNSEDDRGAASSSCCGREATCQEPWSILQIQRTPRLNQFRPLSASGVQRFQNKCIGTCSSQPTSTGSGGGLQNRPSGPTRYSQSQSESTRWDEDKVSRKTPISRRLFDSAI